MTDQRIYKYPLRVADVQLVDLPDRAVMLDVQEQHGRLVLWALVDSSAPVWPRRVHVVGTGNPMPAVPGEYVATVQTEGGHLVWHVFVETGR